MLSSLIDVIERLSQLSSVTYFVLETAQRFRHLTEHEQLAIILQEAQRPIFNVTEAQRARITYLSLRALIVGSPVLAFVASNDAS